MTYNTFAELVSDALETTDFDRFLAERGWQDWMEEYGDDTDRMVADLRNIFDVAHMSLADIRHSAGLTQAATAKRFSIPRRTYENWERLGNCAIYLRLMIADLLGLITVPRTPGQAS